jgi:hypothetical protein
VLHAPNDQPTTNGSEFSTINQSQSGSSGQRHKGVHNLSGSTVSYTSFTSSDHLNGNSAEMKNMFMDLSLNDGAEGNDTSKAEETNYTRKVNWNLSLAECKVQKFTNTTIFCYNVINKYTAQILGLRVLLPATLTFGTIGNILCIITLLNKTFRKTSTGFILIHMAVIDIGQMIAVVVELWSGFVMDDVATNESPILHFSYGFLRQLSALALCMLTVERVVSIYRPMHCKLICSQRRIVIAQFIGAVVCALVNSHVFQKFNRSQDKVNETSSCCRITSDYYEWFYWHIWIVLRSCIEVYIVLVFIIIGNGLIVVKVMKRRVFLTLQTSSQSAQSIASMKSLTLILVVESVLFLLLNVPVEITRIPAVAKIMKDLPMSDYFCAILISYLLTFFGWSLNFLLYMVVGGKFRAAFRETFGGLLGCVRNRVSNVWNLSCTKIPTTERGKSLTPSCAETTV